MDLGKDLNRFFRDLIKRAILGFVAIKTKLSYNQAEIVWDTTSRLVKEAAQFSDKSGAQKREWVCENLRQLAATAMEQGIIDSLTDRDVNWIIETVLEVVL